MNDNLRDQDRGIMGLDLPECNLDLVIVVACSASQGIIRGGLQDYSLVTPCTKKYISCILKAVGT